MRTCLSREFAFLGREAAVFRGCPGRDERRGRQRHAGRGNIGPTGGNISVGPYSGTAPPVMRSATQPDRAVMIIAAVPTTALATQNGQNSGNGVLSTVRLVSVVFGIFFFLVVSG